MQHSSAALFAALIMWGSTSPVFACRGASNATIVKWASEGVVSAGVDQYNVKVEPNLSQPNILVKGTSRDFGFCVDLSVLESSDSQDTAIGVVFWSTTADLNNAYILKIRNDQYEIYRNLFGKVYELVPWTTDASIKKGLRQKNEVDLRVTATGVDIQINGTQLPNFVARPSADAENYGVIFATPQTGTGLFQVGSPRIVK